MEDLKMINRTYYFCNRDLETFRAEINDNISNSSFLVIGGAGSIGQAVVKEIFARNPKKLHVVDISENNLVELVRDIRSSFGYISGEFKTFALDVGTPIFDAFIQGQKYDYILNLSALKHVRSEKDPYTLMRLIDVNIFNTEKTVNMAYDMGAKKYFCVSTDKAANPVNMMGASKRIMEMFLFRASEKVNVSTARFANVAFSDGSLLHGFNMRLQKMQPISAPNDVKRYFVVPKESGQLCLLSCMLGDNRDIFFPKLGGDLKLTKFSEIAVRFLENKGYEPYLCETEDEARAKVEALASQKKWPCYFFKSDTTGEKDYEEFYTEDEVLDLQRFESVGIIKNEAIYDNEKLEYFRKEINTMKSTEDWKKEEVVELFKYMIPNFLHEEKNKSLDERM